MSLERHNATTFVDASGTTSGTPNTFTSAFPALAGPSARNFTRISNNNATGNLLIYDKVGTALVASSFVLTPGQSYSWDVRTTNSAIMVAGSAASMTYEGCVG